MAEMIFKSGISLYVVPLLAATLHQQPYSKCFWQRTNVIIVYASFPGVIIGAVVGCVLGATFIAAVLGFIFWKKRRY